MQQRSVEWHEIRAGRFTGSKASELLSSGSRPMTDEELVEHKKQFPKSQKKTTSCPGETFKTLCFEVAVGRVFGYDPEWNVDTWDMRRGTETEPEAFEVLAQIMKREFLKLEECSFFPYGENAGASPDGIVLGKPIVAEIKCPRPEKVFKLIATGEIDDDHFKQMQFEMLCTNSEICYYFNYAIWKGEPIYHLIKVPRCEETIEKIKERIKLGEIEVQKHVERLLNNKQF